MATAACTPSSASLRCQAQQHPAPRIALVQPLRPVLSLGRTSTVLQCRRPAPQHSQERPLVKAAAADGDAAAAGGSSSSSSSSSAGHSHGHGGRRHAFLHDFCMCIPYGALVAAGGLAGKLFGWGQPATVMMVVGSLQMALSYFSLKVWRQNKSAAPFTLAEAGLAGWLAYYAYRAVQQGVSSLVMGCLLGLSAAMALFLVYNVAAGGNPPRRGTHSPAAAAAS